MDRQNTGKLTKFQWHLDALKHLGPRKYIRSEIEGLLWDLSEIVFRLGLWLSDKLEDLAWRIGKTGG